MELRGRAGDDTGDRRARDRRGADRARRVERRRPARRRRHGGEAARHRSRSARGEPVGQAVRRVPDHERAARTGSAVQARRRRDRDGLLGPRGQDPREAVRRSLGRSRARAGRVHRLRLLPLQDARGGGRLQRSAVRRRAHDRAVQDARLPGREAEERRARSRTRGGHRASHPRARRRDCAEHPHRPEPGLVGGDEHPRPPGRSTSTTSSSARIRRGESRA